MFFQKKKLFESDPATLDIDSLCLLQGSLTAKLILVNKELLRRWESLDRLSEGVPGSEESKRVFSEGVKWLRGFNVLLENCLAQITGKLPKT